ncbi:hypothetical protein AGMMS49965_13170 [Bacteroidia bacterium]|nr:hypothetical protein AGMMS49965_13170 [Bacteroidia bacterium]
MSKVKNRGIGQGKGGGGGHPARTDKEQIEILQDMLTGGGRTKAEIARKHGISKATLMNYQRNHPEICTPEKKLAATKELATVAMGKIVDYHERILSDKADIVSEFKKAAIKRMPAMDDEWFTKLGEILFAEKNAPAANQTNIINNNNNTVNFEDKLSKHLDRLNNAFNRSDKLNSEYAEAEIVS